MKKNISINISGIIFHIEEDGYDTLKKYLDSVAKYFSAFDDSAEILADIESRMAEIFLSKLNEGKQVITAEDVASLMATMGSVSDFKAAEEEQSTADEGQAQQTYREPYSSYAPPRQLLRDQKRKILGGVCAGLARYINIDPVWIRLLFALFAVAYGITLLLYVILWLAMPGTYDLEEPAATKKMFRDPETKVLSGVSGGLAAYFGVEVIVIRILFIVFTFVGGIGLLVYIVFWIALPEARSITDRVQMRGEPITLSNIESNIKGGLNIPADQDEHVLVRILLFPFRLIAVILSGLAKVLGPLMEVIRVAIGVFLAFIGLGLVLATVIFLGAALGFFTFPWHSMLDYNDIAFPIENIQNLIPGWMVLAGFVASIIPAILLVLAGFSIVTKRASITPAVGWTLFVLMFVSLISLAVGIPQIAYTFKEDGEYEEERIFDLGGKTALLRINEVGMDDYDGVSLTLKGHASNQIRLVQSFEAQGSTRQNAIENAKTVTYNVEQQDSVLIFDSNIHFDRDTQFRAQRLELSLYFPYDYPFVMDEAMSRFITQYIDWEFLDGYTWQMTRDGLTCIDCPETEEDSEEDRWNSSDMSGFDEIDLSGMFDLTIIQGDSYSIDVRGSDDEKNKYDVYTAGSTLVLDYDGKKFELGDLEPETVTITITMPSIERFEAKGYGTVRLEGVNVEDDLEIDISGPIKFRGEVEANQVIVSLNGNAEADLSGRASSLMADIKFASRLRAYQLEVADAVVDATGASTAQVNATQSIELDENLGSRIDYRGDPQQVRRNQ